MKNCIVCAKELQEDMRYCPYCGTLIDADCRAHETKIKKKGGCLRIVLLILLLIGITIVTIIVKGNNYKNNLDPYDGMSIEEFINSCYEVEYDELMRYPEKYENEHVIIKGTVIQVIGTENYCEYRISTRNNYDDVVFVSHVRNDIDPRLLEDDKVVIFGLSEGLITYESTAGYDITIPKVYASIIELK